MLTKGIADVYNVIHDTVAKAGGTINLQALTLATIPAIVSGGTIVTIIQAIIAAAGTIFPQTGVAALVVDALELLLSQIAPASAAGARKAGAGDASAQRGSV